MPAASYKNNPNYRTYRCYWHMRNRCENPKTPNYSNYGGKGIVVCERWRESFENFLEDMGPRPSMDHTLDRKDNTKPYEPGNCRWATPTEQLDNRRNTIWVEHNGKRQTLSAWAKETGIAYPTLHHRYKQGWPTEDLLAPTTEERARPRKGTNDRIVEFRGETRPLREWSKIVGIPYATLWHRLYEKNLPPEEALTTPVKAGGWAKAD